MSSKVRSARGELVDFKLLELKAQLASQKPSPKVKARKEAIEGPKEVIETPTQDDGVLTVKK
jgi:hypothetical protein